MRCSRFVVAGLGLALAVLAGAPGGATEPDALPPIGAPGTIDAIPLGPTPAERLEVIRKKVQDALVYPEAARTRGIAGTARIQFAIGADGLATDIGTVDSSGSALLDRAAEQAAVRAGRLPHLYGRVRIPIQFALEQAR